MNDILKEKFIEVYSPLVLNFLQKVAGLNVEGIPEPHIPVYGKNYQFARDKIAFFGIQTRGYGALKDFISDAEKNIETALYRTEGEFDEFDFTDWTNNPQTSFWDFILQFLSKFYCINEWQKLKNKEHTEVLSSFIWGNTNALESYDVTAKGKGVDLNNWMKVKEASKIFDNANYTIKVFEPKIIFILNWKEDFEWLTKDKDHLGPFEMEDHVQYFYLRKTDTHVFWLAHPRWIAPNLTFDKCIDVIIKTIKDKNVFEQLPNRFSLEDFFISPETIAKSDPVNISSISYKREYLYQLAKFLVSHDKVMTGQEVCNHFNQNNIKTGYGTAYSGGRGIYTLFQATWNYYSFIEKNSKKAEYIALAFVNQYGDPAYQ